MNHPTPSNAQTADPGAAALMQQRLALMGLVGMVLCLGAIPSDVEALVLQCLEKAPADRPASAKALHDALAAYSAAGHWTDADARVAWTRLPERRRPLPISTSPDAKTQTQVSWRAKTIAVDLVERASLEPQPPETPR